MTVYGADADELDRLALAFRRAADELDREGGLMTQLLNNVSWIGDVAGNFVSGWSGIQVPKIGLSTTFLREAADDLSRNAAEQRQGSDRGTGATTTPGDRSDHHGNRESEVGPDAGGTYSLEDRGIFDINDSGVTGGRSLIENLLLACSNEDLIAADEFMIIRVEGTDRYIVVLPGVTDLSRPDLGLNDFHHSARDLDQHAIASARSSEIDDNVYAIMVREALARANVPPGAQIMLVGHSYGADTALDLAANDEFNGGPDGYNVTHVVAAGYHSVPQLDGVDPATKVLVLQNHRDLAVLAENALYDANQALGDYGEGDAAGASMNRFEAARSVINGGLGVAGDGAQFLGGSVVNAGADSINRHLESLGVSNRVGAVDWGDFDDIYLLNDGVTRVTDTQTVVVFEGDAEGAGHHPRNYVKHVVSTDDPATTDFLNSIPDGGYYGRMERVAVDISVPVRGRSGGW